MESMKKMEKSLINVENILNKLYNKLAEMSLLIETDPIKEFFLRLQIYKMKFMEAVQALLESF